MSSLTRRTFLSSLGASAAGASLASGRSKKRPNILFAITEDQSWLHAGAYGTPAVHTPAFDRVASEGVLFTQAYCAAPSCAPSRSAITTGQEIWRLEEGGVLFGSLPAKFPVYPDLLEEAGYHVGHTGSGWNPGSLTAGGRERSPCGPRYDARKLDDVPPGISSNDYVGNFEDFLAARPADAPFCFWFGTSEAHRSFPKGAGLRSAKKLEDAAVPAFLPDTEEVRSDILDYYFEIEWFDRAFGKMLRMLEEAGELDNTIIVATSDNGMAFPRAKANLYDWGVRMPLAVRWGEKVPGDRVVDDFVPLTDLAPTFLEAAGIEPPEQMTGRSLVSLLQSGKSGRVEADRDQVVTAFERHTWCRPGGKTYPMRAIRTHDFLYIRNYEPDRWPAGDPEFDSPHQGVYGDIDRSPTRAFMLEHQNDPEFKDLFELAFRKRPGEELYDAKADPGQMKNLAESPEHAETKAELAERLAAYLRKTDDPRQRGESPWDDYPYYFGKFAPNAEK